MEEASKIDEAERDIQKAKCHCMPHHDCFILPTGKPNTRHTNDWGTRAQDNWETDINQKRQQNGIGPFSFSLWNVQLLHYHLNAKLPVACVWMSVFSSFFLA